MTKEMKHLGNVIVKDDISIIATSQGTSNTKVKCERIDGAEIFLNFLVADLDRFKA